MCRARINHYGERGPRFSTGSSRVTISFSRHLLVVLCIAKGTSMVQILLVDAVAAEARIFSEALRSGSTGDRPIEVAVVPCPREAVALASRQRCDVVVADLNLPRPGWSGSYVLRRVRELCPRVRAFLISETDAWEPFLHGAADGVIVRRPAGKSPSSLAEQLLQALYTCQAEPTEVALLLPDTNIGEQSTAGTSRLVHKDRSPGVGAMIAGKYLLKAELGQGGMGIVFRAADTFIGREVAVKLLKFPAFLAGDQVRDRMRREVMITGRLSHPNLATVFDAGIENGELYIVLELIEGCSLKESLLDRPQWSVAEALLLGLQILEALEYTHGLGIVHRDLKPGNILIGSGNRIKVVDFGIAKLMTLAGESLQPSSSITQMTSPGAVLGTPAYMAPEQLQGEEVDARTDLYSLGAVLFEMLHGCALSALFSPFARGKRESLPLLGGDRRLTDLIEKALAQDPAERFASAAEMKAALIELGRSDEIPRRAWWQLGARK